MRVGITSLVSTLNPVTLGQSARGALIEVENLPISHYFCFSAEHSKSRVPGLALT
jgi:hypothetical protein